MKLPALLCWHPIWCLQMRHKPKASNETLSKTSKIDTYQSMANNRPVELTTTITQQHYFSFITCSLCGNVMEFHLAEEPVTQEERRYF